VDNDDDDDDDDDDDGDDDEGDDDDDDDVDDDDDNTTTAHASSCPIGDNNIEITVCWVWLRQYPVNTDSVPLCRQPRQQQGSNQYA
jgi:hypothetical protein